jgi:predicted HTH transcriptional regulator
MDFGEEIAETRLLERLRNGEDNFVERKVIGQQKKVLRVAVSFANSAPVGIPCVIFFGVNDDGTLEGKDFDTDALQKNINSILENTYPRVPYQQKTLRVGSKQIVAVVVIGSELRPHFAGHAYVRRGSESIDASQEQLDLLIAQRSGKMYRLAQNINQPMTLNIKFNQGNRTFTMRKEAGTIHDCNESWVTVLRQSMNPPQLFSFPLATVDIGWDHQHRRIELFVEKDQPF